MFGAGDLWPNPGRRWSSRRSENETSRAMSGDPGEQRGCTISVERGEVRRSIARSAEFPPRSYFVVIPCRSGVHGPTGASRISKRLMASSGPRAELADLSFCNSRNPAPGAPSEPRFAYQRPACGCAHGSIALRIIGGNRTRSGVFSIVRTARTRTPWPGSEVPLWIGSGTPPDQ